MGSNASKVGRDTARSTSPAVLPAAETTTVRARLNIPIRDVAKAKAECESPFRMELKTNANGTAPSRNMMYIGSGR